MPIAIALIVGIAGTLLLAAGVPALQVQRQDTPLHSPLPIVVLAVDQGEITKGATTTGTMQIIQAHDGTHVDVEAGEPSVRTRVALEIRGESTAELPKPSYNVELHDEQGDEHELALLGLPKQSDWVLHGCGRDQTCLRNALVYGLVRDSGRYAPRTRFVEVYLNREYRGLYVLTERVRRDANRVDLPRPAPGMSEGDISGGYIFRMELGQGSPRDEQARDWVSPVSPMVYTYLYPRFNRITEDQRNHLHRHMAAFETMMASDGWNHPESGYPAWLDLPSWVDFALVQELSNNVDAYQKSVYLQKWPQSRGGRIALGPVWDFDLAFGSVEFRDGRRTDVWAHTMNRFGAEKVEFDPPGRIPHVPAYWERLWSDAAFRNTARCRWDALRQGPLADAALASRIDGLVREIAPALTREGPQGSNPRRDGYFGEVDELKTFLNRRLTWMDANLPGTCSR